MWSRGSGAVDSSALADVPPTVVNLTTLADFPPTVVDSGFGLTPRSNRVLRVGSCQSRNFHKRQWNRLSDCWNWIANVSPHSRSEGVVFLDVLKL